MSYPKLLAVAALLFVQAALAAIDGNAWNAAPASQRLAEMERVLGNIRRSGCTVKRTPDYFVKQLNDFYREPSTRSIALPQALGLVATAAGEKWDC